MSARSLALVALLLVASCKKKELPQTVAIDGGPFDRPADHLGKNELVPSTETLLGMPVPRDFEVTDVRPDEATARGIATLEELRRHVLEHTMNGVARPEDGILVWFDAEIPGQGAKKHTVRAWRDRAGSAYLSVRELPARVPFDGGNAELYKALNLDGRGYPKDYDQLR